MTYIAIQAVVHVINFDLFERPRSPTSLRSRGSDNPLKLMTQTTSKVHM
jgi:hypothetical protein